MPISRVAELTIEVRHLLGFINIKYLEQCLFNHWAKPKTVHATQAGKRSLQRRKPVTYNFRKLTLESLCLSLVSLSRSLFDFPGKKACKNCHHVKLIYFWLIAFHLISSKLRTSCWTMVANWFLYLPSWISKSIRLDQSGQLSFQFYLAEFQNPLYRLDQKRSMSFSILI